MQPQDQDSIFKIIGTIIGWIAGTGTVVATVLAYLSRKQEISSKNKQDQEDQEADNFEKVTGHLFKMIEKLEKDVIELEVRKDSKIERLEKDNARMQKSLHVAEVRSQEQRA